MALAVKQQQQQPRQCEPQKNTLASRLEIIPFYSQFTTARARQQQDFFTGDVVYYCRERKKYSHVSARRGKWHEPARVIAVEPPIAETRAISIVWVARGCTVVRVALEHLRVATPVEASLEQTLH